MLVTLIKAWAFTFNTQGLTCLACRFLLELSLCNSTRSNEKGAHALVPNVLFEAEPEVEKQQHDLRAFFVAQLLATMARGLEKNSA